MKRALPLLLALLACTPPPEAPSLASLTLTPPQGVPFPLRGTLETHRLTVLSFFSAHCPCQRAHDERVRALIAQEAGRGVAVLVVDSEESATSRTDADESKARGYPIFRDEEGKLAKAVQAEYATYSVVLDPDGRVVYRGGFDSDRTHLKEGRTTYLADAIDDLLAGRPARASETKALGCSLELR